MIKALLQGVEEGWFWVGSRLVAATAAGGRPPSPATAYRPRQTRSENLPWQRCTTHPIEIK